MGQLIADPTPEAIEVETERIIAMCIPLEVDDDPEYADWGAAKYTSATIQTAEERVLVEPSSLGLKSVTCGFVQRIRPSGLSSGAQFVE